MTVKLKAAILSDLHREFWEVSIPYYSADVVVISGDISSPIQKSMDFLVSYANKLQKPVIAVFGNHDFYNSNIDEALLYAKGRAAESKIPSPPREQFLCHRQYQIHWMYSLE